MKKGVSRFPSDDYRAYEEDLQKSGAPSLKKQESTVEDQLNNFEANQKIRGAQLNDSTFTADDSSDRENDQEVKSSMTGASSMMMNAANPNAKLSDFQIKKMIGRGTFGKVYIVENTLESGKLYAMKCIRKDLVLEN